MLFILLCGRAKSSSILISSHHIKRERKERKVGESGERGKGGRYKECF